MKEEATPHLSSHAFRCPSIMTCGWYAFKEELLIPESQFAHKIGKIGVVVDSLVYLLTNAFIYPFTLYHVPGSILETGDKTGLIGTVLEVLCSVVAVLSFLIILSLDLYFVSTVQCDSGRRLRILPCLLASLKQVLNHPFSLIPTLMEAWAQTQAGSELEVCALHPMSSDVGSGCL